MKTNLEKVKGKHYDIAGISTIVILESIAECIYNVFLDSVIPYDKNLEPKESKELIKLCKRACDRIAKEIK